MRWILVFLLLSSCNGFEKEEIVYPDKPLQEIIFYGSYYPPEEDREEEYRYSGQRYCYKRTEEDKRFEGYEGRLLQGFEDKTTTFLKAQLYSKEDGLLTETFFMMQKQTENNFYHVEAYLPYHPEAYEKHIVRVEGDKEILLDKEEVFSIEEMSSKTTFYYPQYKSILWHYDPEVECHIAPGPL